MNVTVVQNAVGEFLRKLGQARDALRQVEAGRYGPREEAERIHYEYPEGQLAACLNDLQQRLMVLLDAADMPNTRASLDAAWSVFQEKPDGLSTVHHNDDFERSFSPALTYVERVLQTLLSCVDKGISSTEAIELERLEWILGRTGVLVHGRGESISDEHHLQRIMHDYLSAAFPDFVKNFAIPGGLKNFKPDCGIRGLSAAIEFKVVHTKPEVARAISGVIEDIGGYRGSKDWIRFYSVFYQAHPFMTEAEVRRELKRTGGNVWTPFVVNEPTNRKTTRRARIVKRVE
jgi:hypothetical protein